MCRGLFSIGSGVVEWVLSLRSGSAPLDLQHTHFSHRWPEDEGIGRFPPRRPSPWSELLTVTALELRDLSCPVSMVTVVTHRWEKAVPLRSSGNNVRSNPVAKPSSAAPPSGEWLKDLGKLRVRGDGGYAWPRECLVCLILQ